jgi:hypothetical protein
MDPKAVAYFRDHGIPALNVRGMSMGAALPGGTRVHVAASAPRAGDVVVYTRGGDLIIHRLAFAIGDRCITIGDNTAVPDPVIRKHDIIGVVPGLRRAALPATLRVARHFLGRAFRRLIRSA